MAETGIVVSTYMRGKLKTSDPDKLRISIEIDGTMHKVGWGINHFRVSPGRHTVAIHWAPRPKGKRATIEVEVGQELDTRVRFDAPRWTWQPGVLTLE